MTRTDSLDDMVQAILDDCTPAERRLLQGTASEEELAAAFDGFDWGSMCGGAIEDGGTK